MPVEVKLPTTFRKFTGGKKKLEMEPGNIDSMIKGIISQYPGLEKKLLDEEGKINKFINIFLNEEKLDFPGGLDTEVKDKDKVLILLAISGG